MFANLTSQVVETELGGEVQLNKKLKEYFLSFLSSFSGIIKAELDGDYKINHHLLRDLSDEVKKKSLNEMFDWDLGDDADITSRRCECFIASDADFVSRALKNSAEGESNLTRTNKFSEVGILKLIIIIIRLN